MSKELNIDVQQDHLESLTRASGITAISELIWNALDADASFIKISFNKNVIDSITDITIDDNGHGLDFIEAEKVFQKLGGSIKTTQNFSPEGRKYHGKEGKGRFKAFALGDLITFKSTFLKNGDTYSYDIQIDRNNLKKTILGELIKLETKLHSGFQLKIENINDKKANEIMAEIDLRSLHEIFAMYHINYPNFSISIDSKILDFQSLIKNTISEEISKVDNNDNSWSFTIKIVEWKFDSAKRTYLCNEKGIPYLNLNLGIRSTLPISIFIESDYIDYLQQQNALIMSEMNELLDDIINESKKIARNYIRNRLHYYSKDFINSLKKENIYPYLDEPTEEYEIAKRQVFDIVTLQVNEFLPSFNDNDSKSKKFTLALIKEALEKDTSSLQKILTEIIELPNDKKEDLIDLLEKTSLVDIINTMTEITNRLNFLHGLELLIYDPSYSSKVKERKHLHKILINETWIFGDEYTYGVDDLSLKNVLKQYLTFLGRDDFEEIINSEDNSELTTIPDVCLWKQFNLGKPELFENLIIELKKPIVDAGFKELTQIQSYAQKVINDSRFPKEKTKWTFILLVRDIKEEIEPQMNQENRKYGHILDSKHADVFVVRWGNIISEAKSRFNYVKEKLNLSFKSNQEALDYLKEKYHKYLPEEFGRDGNEN